ncbi:MAG: Rha family transcriptional regulator, partial [Candidatus Methylumidiphilus sp.]
MDELALTTTATEARVDTRLLAHGFGNKHKAAMALIERYSDRFKSFGQLTFKKEVGKRKQGGGNAERYALLNEDQAYFLLSLSRNNDT